MPHKAVDKILILPEWVEEVTDPCLRDTLTEAIVTRNSAVRGGAEEHMACAAALRSGDRTLDRIAYGKVSKQACAKAATALRKYNTAAECAHPTATKKRR